MAAIRERTIPTGARNRKVKARSCGTAQKYYIGGVNCLTAQERKVLIIVMLLLTIGELVKVYRAGHPPAVTIQKSPA